MRLRKHCCIWKCLRITHGMLVENERQTRKESRRTTWYIQRNYDRQTVYHASQSRWMLLHMLLVNVPGPTSFQQLRIVNGVTHAIFRSACQALNLLNDQHWDVCIKACNTSHSNQIRALFAIILTACSPSSPTELWEKYKSHMAEDIFRQILKENSNMNMDFTAEIYNEVLIMIEDLCLEISNKVLNQLGMPSPNRSAAASFDVGLLREQSYNTDDLLLFCLRFRSRCGLLLARTVICCVF